LIILVLSEILRLLLWGVYIRVKNERQETNPAKQDFKDAIKKVDLLESDFRQKVTPLLDHFDFKLIVQKIDSLESDFRQKVIPLWEHFQNNSQNHKMSYA